MYNIKQISIYCLLSFLLSIIITIFYIKKLNKEFYLLLILLFIVFYLFFYLINLENKEGFNNADSYIENYNKLYGFSNLRNNIRTMLPEEEEHHHKLYKKHSINEEEEEHNYNKLYQNHIIKEEEEEEKHHQVYKKYSKSNNKKNKNNQIQEEETKYTPVPQEEEILHQPQIKNNNLDLEKLSINNSLKGNTCSPVNINIYNGEVEKSNKNKSNNTENNCNNQSKNLGDYKSRVYNNSDWIYGNNAWTDTPDFYIPTPNDLLPPYKNNVENISQKQNEVLLKKKFSESKMVCPMMVNTPWSEYKSGDKEPEGFNI